MKTEMEAKTPSTSLWPVRLLVGLGLITAVVSRFPLTEALATLKRVDPIWLTALLAVAHGGIAAMTLAWKLLLGSENGKVRLTTLYGFTLLGAFFNNFLPTTVGGDAARIYALSRKVDKPSVAAGATSMERILGLAAVLVLTPWALSVFQITTSARFLLLVGPLVALMFGSALLFLSPFVRLGWINQDRTWGLQRLWSFLEQTISHIQGYRGRKKTVAAAFLLCLVFYLNKVFVLWLAAKAVGAEATYFSLLAVEPLVVLVSLVPISMNGLGLMEGGYSILLIHIGLSPAEALSVALIIRGRLLLTAVLGGGVFAFSKLRQADRPSEPA